MNAYFEEPEKYKQALKVFLTNAKSVVAKL